MKGIILAGGSGTRLHPATLVVTKQLLPVYDKPMIYYPLVTLMLADIRDILIITKPEDLEKFRSLLGDGSQWGIRLQYAVQSQPRGIAEAFLIGREFIGNDSCALILGDNIFFGLGLRDLLMRAASVKTGAFVFAHWVADPERYGVLDMGADRKVKAILEKPNPAPSNWAVTGLYFYGPGVADVAAGIKPSPRGELEVTDVNSAYLARNELQVQVLGRGFAWLDAGTPESLLDASNFIATVEKRQGLKISVPEEIAWRLGFIDAAQVAKIAAGYGSGPYGKYLEWILAMG
ncbi:MAG: glucose-1-phosphate thymidylyltransferase RfbA [Rhodospirillaceae bacterium]|nr:glucose-1-phosphate thymidylyltransferase RfbA [Rhodospirillaceae bacterium]